MTATDNSIFQSGKSSKLEGMSEKLGYDIPTEFVTLPSAGKLYPREHPLCDAEGVEIRSMTAREEDLLTSKALIKAGTVIDKLLEACITNKSIDARSLLIGDRNALLIAVRVVGYGEDYKAKVTCPECSELFQSEFSLGSLRIKPVGAEPLEPNTNLFAFKLPLSGLSVEFKLLTGQDEADISTAIERRRKTAGSTENNMTTRLLHNIVSINKETDKQKISTMIMNMRAGDARALRKYIDKVEPQIDMRQPASCTQCGAESEVNVPLGANFFWPDFDS